MATNRIKIAIKWRQNGDKWRQNDEKMSIKWR